jgi:hypothetical protein
MSSLPFDPKKLPEKDFRVPDIMGCVSGWRAWGVAKDPPDFGTPPKLRSVTYGAYYWAPKRIAEAHCERCGEADGPGVPGESCSCGFYSAKTLEHLLSMSYHMYDADSSGCFHVVGQVANWGKVIEGTQGWRSQFSYPVKLYVPFEAWRLTKPLTKAYGIPCALKNTLRRESENIEDLLKGDI